MRHTTPAPPLAWWRVFPGTTAHVREARQFLAALVDGCPAAADAALCLSELATNAVVHSRSREPGGHFIVRAELCGQRLRVEVRPWVWPDRDDQRHGRGLLIVSRLARSWGRSGDPGSGWTVWFELDCP